MKLKKVKRLISKYCDLLKIPLSERPSFKTLDPGDDRVEIDYIEGEYWYITNDKINRFNNSSTNDGEELVYWIFSDITFSMAEIECMQKKYDDQREYKTEIANIQLNLMLKLDKKMYNRLKDHHVRLSQMIQ